MKNRILSIADKSKKKTGIIVICFALILTICTSLVLAANAPSTENPNSDLSESLVENPKEDAILTENSNETVTMQINSLSITTPKGQEPILNDDGTITLPGGGIFERLFNGDKLTVLSGAVIESNGNIDESHPANKGKKIILESANGDIMVIDESGTVFINGKTVEEICNEAAAMRATADENVEEDIENLDFYGDWEYNGHLQLQDNISWKGYNEGNNYVYELKTDGTKITVSPPSTIDCLNNKKYGYIKFNKECKIDYLNGVTVNAPINTLIEFENDIYTITIGDGEAIITRQSGIPETIPTGTVLNNKGDIRSDYIIKESDMDEIIRYPAPGEKNNHSAYPEEEYAALMKLKTDDYRELSVKEFIARFVDVKSIYRGHNPNDENVEFLTALLYTGKPEIGVATASNKRTSKNEYYGAGLSYTFAWAISDEDKITVGERDDILNACTDAVRGILESKNRDELQSSDIIAVLQSEYNALANSLSNGIITIKIVIDDYEYCE